MTDRAGEGLAAVGVDAAALKPSEVDVRRATALDVDLVTIDYEGRDHLPSMADIDALRESATVRVTIPVRADGFDPMGDDHLWHMLPDDVGHVLVAGHPAYLSEAERDRALAPRFKEATEKCMDPWIGTEGIERIAMALGGTQFELLTGRTERTVEALRTAGFDGDIAVYAPTALAADDDAILDAVGSYAARRQAVAARLPRECPHDCRITGQARDILLDACQTYGLVGDSASVAERIESLRAAGVDHIVAYPARGVEPLLRD